MKANVVIFEPKGGNSLKRRIKNILLFLMTFFETMFSLSLVLIYSRKVSLGHVAQRNKIFILGNGPSLKDDLKGVIALSAREEIDVCAVNDFAFSDVFFDIRPSIYVLADPGYWADNVGEDLSVRRARLLEIFSERVTWPMQVMLPIDARKSSIFNNLISGAVTYSFYNRTPLSGFKWLIFRFFDLGVGMPPPYNVLIAAITLSLLKGYKQVFILGADHSWHEELSVATGKKVQVAQKHFYDNKVEQKPVYKEAGETFTIGDLFIRWGKVFKMYETLYLYAKHKNSQVYNLSSKTYIDAFPRSSLDEFRDL